MRRNVKSAALGGRKPLDQRLYWPARDPGRGPPRFAPSRRSARLAANMLSVAFMTVRCGSLMLMLALVLGAGPAVAQYYDGPGDTGVFTKPKPDETAKKAVKKAVRKHRPPRRATAKPPRPQPAPVTKSATAKPKATQSIAAKATTTKPERRAMTSSCRPPGRTS